MIIRLVKMTFHQEHAADFEALFNEVKDRIAQFPGCQMVELLRETPKNGSQVYLTRSMWNTEDDLESYRQSELFARTWSATKALFSSKPEAWSTQSIAKALSEV